LAEAAGEKIEGVLADAAGLVGGAREGEVSGHQGLWCFQLVN
jgi:hypothetical protein